MAQPVTATGPIPPPIVLPGTSLSRSALLTGALIVGSALGGSAVGPAVADPGTRIGLYTDVAALAHSTSLQSVELDGPFVPFIQRTTMAQINGLAPLSLREWGRVFGVSHTSISAWMKEDPADREKLGTVLGALEAARTKPQLERWLLAPLQGIDVRPIDLLRDGRWRAFRGALVARAAAPATLSSEELAARRRAETSWALADAEIEPDDEA